MGKSILIVDDEHDIAATLAYALEQEGWQTLVAHDGRTALDLAGAHPTPDLVLLDLMLPDLSGTEVCRTLRSQEHTKAIPIVMLTARNDEIDRVVGFEVGADDYVGKPFSVRELVLRVKAILRRADQPDATGSELRFGRLRLDAAGHQVWVDSEEIPLTALEFRLLSTLLTRRGRVLTRETLLHDVWGHDPGLPTRTVDTHIQRLRKKIGPASRYIETLRGTGYRFRASPEMAG
ncbi:response regulator [Paraliomyxa miuraensis]|uniref:response regulator n=1 Tax=Paraliomyxa miuraensis TaxID=376150 RepID=UPI0022554440|nr:response regulator transcription factor [Paraliomyxa miuraensis]MCX4241251.1 response regulator transcription factor [Paraliomyxa miuraensis]